MNLFAKMGLPDLVTLNTALTDFLGPLAPLVVTVLNGMAFLIIILLVVQISKISIRAIAAFNDPGEGHIGLLSKAIRSGAEAFALALAGYLVISAGPNVIYAFATGATTGLLAQQTDYLPQFLGPFAGLAAATQNFVSLGVVVLGAFLAGKTWFSALAQAGYHDKSGPGAGGQMGAWQEAAKRTAVLVLLVILAFATVLKGPQLFFSIIHGSSGLINSQVLP